MKRIYLTDALKKMVEIAGYKYEDCHDGEHWFYDKTWTQEQSDEFRKWFISNIKFGNKKFKESQWAMFNLCYGFRIVVK